MLSPATTAKSIFCGSGCSWRFNATTLYASAALSATWHSRVQEINFKCFFYLYFFFNVLKSILSYFLAQGPLSPKALKKNNNNNGRRPDGMTLVPWSTGKCACGTSLSL